MPGRSGMIRIFAGLACAVMAGLASTHAVADPDAEHVSTTTSAATTSGLPESMAVLSAEDRDYYRRIFTLQAAGKWSEADRLIRAVDNDILMGHVLFQRYMHPKSYRSSYSELSRWMSRYADHPGARRLYDLALKRRGKARWPKRPTPLTASIRAEEARKADQPRPQGPSYSRDDRASIRSLDYRLRREIKRGHPERAERYLWAFEPTGIFNQLEFDERLSQVAQSHYLRGDDEKALALASLAARRSRDDLVEPDWYAGLAAWRLGNCNAAAAHFERVAHAKTQGPWLRSAGAFWAARAHLVCQRPERVEALLRFAARDDETFYGIIAARQLGISPRYDWDLPVLTAEDYAGIAALPGVRRAIALVEVGELNLADDELLLVWGRQGEKLWQPLVALAARLSLPATQIKLSRKTPEGATTPHSVRYPVPSWEPEGGFSIDRAVMFAIMRQESAFAPRAKSYAGALGLMQVMPATASFLERDRSLRRSNKWKLYEPEFNMRLSQDYIKMLLGYEVTEGNLFKFATAYNGGPGNLGRWKKRMKYNNDPLLFVESIPAQQTRIYIERVFANMWIYRDRFGQPAPSLDAVASGAWPPYDALDGEVLHLAGSGGATLHAGN